MSEMDELIAYAQAHEHASPESGIPSRHVALVTCMDARIDDHEIFGFGHGQVHVIRNAGGIVTDDVLRSLVLSQRLLGTREVMLVHHTRCGLNRPDDHELRAQIRAETGVEPDYAFGVFGDVDKAVARAIERVREHVFLPHRDRVRGFVFDVATGHPREIIVG
jgi:carbonic anhydrase